MRWLPYLVAALALVWVGVLVGRGSDRTSTVTVTATTSTQTQGSLPADPSFPANCVQEPDGINPMCSQGNYRVSVTIGAPCAVAGQSGTWQWRRDEINVAECSALGG